MVKHVGNNERKMFIIARNLWLWYYVEKEKEKLKLWKKLVFLSEFLYNEVAYLYLNDAKD
jgi:hypothetical protein